jgi:lipopolysaccharide heptosyltransferase II
VSVIAVRVPNWLGDTVMALPALAALRAARPEARIIAVGRWASLLSGQGVADILLPYPRPVRERLAFGRSLRQEPPDLALLLVNSLESALAAWRWGARRRLGFDTDARRALLTDAIGLPSPRHHQIDEYGLLLSASGTSMEGDATPVWRLRSSALMDAEVDGLLSDVGVDPSARVIGLHLGAAFGPSKRWSPESFGRLAALLERDALRPLLLGSEESHETALAVAEAAGCPLPSLVGRDRPALLPGLLARLSCLVSGDTGVAHLAAALRVPTVTLFGPTDPRLTAPRAKTARVLFRQVACSPCFLSECPIDHICMSRIDPEEVLSQVRSVVTA